MVSLFSDLNGADFSPCRRWRYRLWRTWDPSLPRLAWLLCNPSKANEDDPDPTVTRVTGFTRGFGFGGFVLANMFGLVSTDPKGLLNPGWDPVGIGNDAAILRSRDECGMMVAAWGTVGGRFNDRVCDVLGLLEHDTERPAFHCLGKTRAGHPKHPVRLAASTRLEPWP